MLNWWLSKHELAGFMWCLCRKDQPAELFCGTIVVIVHTIMVYVDGPSQQSWAEQRALLAVAGVIRCEMYVNEVLYPSCICFIWCAWKLLRSFHTDYITMSCPVVIVTVVIVTVVIVTVVIVTAVFHLLHRDYLYPISRRAENTGYSVFWNFAQSSVLRGEGEAAGAPAA